MERTNIAVGDVAVAEPQALAPAERVLGSAGSGRPTWVRSPLYDGIFLLGGVLLIAFIIGMYYVVKPFDSNLLHLYSYAQFVNILVPVLLGGPHIFMSFLRNYMDSEFRMRYPAILRVMPHAVFLVVLTLTVMPREIGAPILMNVIFYSALFHGLSQLTHLTVKYDLNHRKEAALRREMALNAALIFGGPLAYVFHAIGTRHFVFVGAPIYPVFSQSLFVGAIAFAWLAAAGIYLVDSGRDLLAGRFNVQRFLTIIMTQIAFVVLVEVGNADVTFQAYNAWHSFQAMGLFWAASNARWRAGKLYGPAVKLSRDGTLWKAYGAGVLFALTLGVAVVGLSYVTLTGDMSRLDVSPWYFLIPVTALLFHHAMDYLTFFRRGAYEY